MPYDQVLHKFKKGQLHSGSKKGPRVTSRSQAIAIMLSEKRKADAGVKEYQSKKKSKKSRAKRILKKAINRFRGKK